MSYHISHRCSSHSVPIWPSPTFCAKSHDLWGSLLARCLDIVHEKIPPNACGTIVFPDCSRTIISAFNGKLTDDVRNRNRKVRDGKLQTCSWGPLAHMAMFGVFEIRESDSLIHMHFIARGFDLARLEKSIKSFNKKNGTCIDLPYCKPPVDVEAISAYPFKFGYDRKVMFQKGTLSRYVYNCGKYFIGGKAKLLEEDPVHYECKKVNRLFDHNMVSCAPDPAPKPIVDQSPEDNQQGSRNRFIVVLGQIPFDLWPKCRKAAIVTKQAIQEVLGPLLRPYLCIGAGIRKCFRKRRPMAFGFAGFLTSSIQSVDTLTFP